MLLTKLPKGSIFLVDKVISRNVFGTQIDGLSQIFFPSLQSLTRQTIHHIYTDIPETCFPASSKSFYSLYGSMSTMKQLQGLFLKGLDAHADAIDRQLTEHCNILGRQVIRIRFEGYFRILLYLIYMIDRREDCFQFFFGKLRRSPSTQVNSFYFFPFHVIPAHFQFSAKRTNVCRLLLALSSREEIAIDTSTFAKRNVDVNACHQFSALC